MRAAKAGIERGNSLDYFKVNIGKANLARASHQEEWYEVKSIPLMNGNVISVGSDTLTSQGDSVGVVAGWKWPPTVSQIDPDAIEHVQRIVSGGAYKENAQSPEWVGNVIGSCFGYDKVKGHATNTKAMVK